MCPAGCLSRLAGATREAAPEGPAQEARARRMPAIASVPTPEAEEELPAAQQAFASLQLFTRRRSSGSTNKPCNFAGVSFRGLELSGPCLSASP